METADYHLEGVKEIFHAEKKKNKGPEGQLMVQNCVEMEGEDSAMISREAVLKLMDEKDKIEADIARLVGVLESNNGVGMHAPLVDADGFPRSDIDVYQVRHARHTIICLQNDHKALMQRIEGGLHAIHAEVRQTGALPEIEDEVGGDPFVRINFVAPGSPAELAGLQVEDQLVHFGTLNAGNFETLQDVAKIVQHSVNTEIPITVRRKTRYLRMHLVPKTWSGRGLLGCNIVPLESVER